MGKRSGNPLAREVLDTPLPTRRRRIAERRRAEAQGESFAHGRVGLLGEITARDTQIQLSRPDIDGNVLGPQEEELDVVDRDR